MLQTKNWGRSKRIGDVILWITLAEALSWRRKFDPDISTDQAFDELRAVCSPQHAKDGDHWRVWASGKSAGWRPMQGWRSGNLPEYRPLEDANHPPTHHPEAHPIPTEEWPNLALPSPEDIDAGKLDYEYERTVAWVDVRFPRDELIVVWRPLIGHLGRCSPQGAGGKETHKRRRGRIPQTFNRVKQEMARDIQIGARDPRDMLEKEWEKTYGASRDTCRRALAQAVLETSPLDNRDKPRQFFNKRQIATF